MAPSSKHNSQSGPILIQGITYRSGTNYLFDLLTLHPHCGFTKPYENFFLAYSHLLTNYLEQVTTHWDPAWGADPALFKAALGQGLLHPMTEAVSPKRLVTKTPNVDQLEHFFDFFPNAYLIILVRDGRSVVESSVRSFGIRFDDAARHWAQAAQLINHFRHNPPRTGLWLLVKYEDLINDLERELRRLFEFLNLDADAYDFAAAQHLPVRGSSDLVAGNDRLHWGKVAKYEGFTPHKRWSAWSVRQHARFNWLAGEQMKALGYPLQPTPPSVGLKLRNIVLDWQFRFATRLKR
jgi:hypothetical protein